MGKTISATFRELRRHLKNNFPAYHHAHLDVWSDYYRLLNDVKENIVAPKAKEKMKKVI